MWGKKILIEYQISFFVHKSLHKRNQFLRGWGEGNKGPPPSPLCSSRNHILHNKAERSLGQSVNEYIHKLFHNDGGLLLIFCYPSLSSIGCSIKMEFFPDILLPLPRQNWDVMGRTFFLEHPVSCMLFILHAISFCLNQSYSVLIYKHFFVYRVFQKNFVLRFCFYLS